MKWFAFDSIARGNYPVVQAKNLASATKRLVRWSEHNKVAVSSSPVRNGIGYETLTEAWFHHPNITIIDSTN